MPYPIHVTVANGATVSSAFYLDRADKATYVYASSHAAIGCRLEFAASSGGTVFGSVYTEDGIVQVFSYAQDAWGVVKAVPTPWARVRLSTGASGTTSFMVVTGWRS
jgi:hypothetical protein